MNPLKQIFFEPVTYFLFYFFMFINTYGHAWHNFTADPRSNEGGVLIASMVSAFFWPLYWSVKAWA